MDQLSNYSIPGIITFIVTLATTTVGYELRSKDREIEELKRTIELLKKLVPPGSLP